MMEAAAVFLETAIGSAQALRGRLEHDGRRGRTGSDPEGRPTGRRARAAGSARPEPPADPLGGQEDRSSTSDSNSRGGDRGQVQPGRGPDCSPDEPTTGAGDRGAGRARSGSGRCHRRPGEDPDRGRGHCLIRSTPVERVEVVSPLGAGDAFMGSLAAGLAGLGWDLGRVAEVLPAACRRRDRLLPATGVRALEPLARRDTGTSAATEWRRPTQGQGSADPRPAARDVRPADEPASPPSRSTNWSGPCSPRRPATSTGTGPSPA